MTQTSHKPILCIDFDGVIHSYENGWQDGELYGTLVPGFVGWAVEASAIFKLVIYSSRCITPGAIVRIGVWMEKQLTEHFTSDEIAHFMSLFEFSNTKPPAFLTIDDRAVCFKGKWNARELHPATLKQFRPWNTKP
jgi:hypothetical protein